MDNDTKVKWAFVASVVAVVVAVLALGLAYASTRVPMTRYAAAREETVAFKNYQIEQAKQIIAALQQQIEEQHDATNDNR